MAWQPKALPSSQPREQHPLRTMPFLNVLVKTTERCPLRCIYCYEGDKSGAIMDEDTLEATVTKLAGRDGAKMTDFIWHGAEPLTAGINFFRKAIELQKPYRERHEIRNGMQSSGVLLTPELADFLVENNISIGFSLDGPAHVHNQTRPYLNGRGSFRDVMRAIRLMRERGKKPGVIAVLTKLSLPHLDEIYDFFKEEQLSFKFNPVMQGGNAQSIYHRIGLTPDEHVAAVTHLFDRWFSDNGNNDYRSAHSIVTGLFVKGSGNCNLMRSCQTSFLGIGTDGTVYPCSRFSEPELSYGNIRENSFEEITSHPLRLRLLGRYDANQACQNCDVNFLCHSGCMHNAYLAGDIMGPDPFCSATKRIYDHIAGRIITQLEQDGALRGGTNEEHPQTV